MAQNTELNRRVTINVMDDVTYRYPGAMYLLQEMQLYPGMTYPNYTSTVSLDKHIASGTMKLKEVLVDKDLTFGDLYANSFECTIFDVKSTKTELVNKSIEINCETIENGQILRTERLFTGIIDSAEQDYYNNYQKIVAYDAVYSVRDKNIAEDWNAYWDTHDEASIQELRYWACSVVGIPYTVSQDLLPNDDTIIYKNEVQKYTSLTFGTLFKMLCELTGTLPNISRAGEMEWVELSTDTSTMLDLSGNERGSNSSYEYYTTKPIDGIAIYASSDSLSQIYPENGNPSNAYVISGNAFLLNKNADDLDIICENLYTQISGISYVPCKVKLIYSDFDIPLGQMISITPSANTHGIGYVLNNELSGAQFYAQTVECKARGEERDQKASSRNDSIVQNGKFSKFEQDIDHIEAEVGKLEDGEEIVSRINLTPGNVKIEAKNIDLTGIVTVEDLAGEGTTVINGSNITTGTISANRIDTNNLFVSGTNVIGSVNQANNLAQAAWNLSNINRATQAALSGSNYLNIGTARVYGSDTYITLASGTSGYVRLYPSGGRFSGTGGTYTIMLEVRIDSNNWWGLEYPTTNGETAHWYKLTGAL